MSDKSPAPVHDESDRDRGDLPEAASPGSEKKALQKIWEKMSEIDLRKILTAVTIIGVLLGVAATIVGIGAYVVRNEAYRGADEALDKKVDDIVARAAEKLSATVKDDLKQLVKNATEDALRTQQDEIDSSLQRVRTQIYPESSISHKPKAVFLVLPNDTREDSPAAYEMRLGFLRALGWNHDPDRVSPPNLFAVEHRLKVQRVRSDHDVEYETIKIVQIEDGDAEVDPVTGTILNPTTVTNLAIAERTYNCVLVVGHSDSTRAAPVCRTYYEPHRVPTILVGPSNPDITINALARHPPQRLYLRLLPTDRIQVGRIVELLKAHGHYNKILIAEDNENRTYSNWIASELEQTIGALDRQPGVSSITIQRCTIPESNIASIIEPYIDDLFDLIIFVGLTPVAQKFIEAWDAQKQQLLPEAGNGGRLPDLLVTDGCTSRRFCTFIRERPGWGNVILLSPMAPSNAEAAQAVVEINYEPLGLAAGGLAQHVLEETAVYGSITRNNVQRVIAALQVRDSTTTIRVDEPGTAKPIEMPDELRAFRFRGSQAFNTVDGDNSAWRYYFYVKGVGASTFVPTDDAATAATILIRASANN